MDTKIKIGIIGTGFARKTQIPAFREIPEAKIVSIASGHLENAESAADDFNIGHFTVDWRETVDREDVDLVCITTPPDTHFEMAMRAIERGKHVLCEKPMAMNSAEAAEMTKFAAEKGVLALIDHELRFVNGRRKAYELLRDGKIGQVRSAKYFFSNASRGNPDLPWNWWSDEKSGGGALGAIGSHVVDSFRWFLGTEISGVYCRLKTNVPERLDRRTGKIREVTSDDEVLMILDFEDSELVENATGLVSLSMAEAGNYRNAVEFFGSKGALRIEDQGEIFFADIRENEWKKIDVERGEVFEGMQETGWSLGFINFSREIIDAIVSGEKFVKNAATFEDGLQVQKILDAARESNNSTPIDVRLSR